MWDTVGIVASVVVVILLIQVLDVSEILKARLRGESTRADLKERVARIEERPAALDGKNGG